MNARAVAHVLFRHCRPMAAVMAICLLAGAGLALAPQPWRAEAVVAASGGQRQRLEATGRSGEEALAKLVAALEALRAPVADDPATAQMAKQAAEARGRLEAWRRKHGAADPAADGKRRAELEGEITAAEAEASALADKLAMLKARLAVTPPTVPLSTDSERSRVVDEAKAKLFELQTREQELLGRYQEASVVVQNLRAERRKVEELLKGLDTPVESRVRTGPNEVHQELEKDVFRTEAALTSARGRAKALARQRDDLDRRLDAAGPGRELERAAEALEARLAAQRAALAGPEVVVVEPPRAVAPRPRWPAAAWAALAALLLGPLAAFAAERLSSRYATPADVERRLGLAVLTFLPHEG